MKKNNLKRKTYNRDTQSKTIISLEDSRSSYDYFKKLCDKWEISNKVLIIPSKGKSNPDNVLKKAKKEYNLLDNVNKVFIVVDKDNHKHENAQEFCKNNADYEYILSIPSFEYWLLLHEKFTDAPFNNTEVCKELSDCLGYKYDKNMDFSYFMKNLKIDKAITYAKDNYKENNNPSTNICLLINHLKNLKS